MRVCLLLFFFIIHLNQNLCLFKTFLGVLISLGIRITRSYFPSAGHSAAPLRLVQEMGQRFRTAIHFHRLGRHRADLEMEDTDLAEQCQTIVLCQEVFLPQLSGHRSFLKECFHTKFLKCWKYNKINGPWRLRLKYFIFLDISYTALSSKDLKSFKYSI